MTTEAMRAQFEALAAINGFYVGCWTPFEQNYVNAETKTAWLAYQAALSSPAVVALVEALRAADGLAVCCMAVDGYSRKELDDMARAT